MLNNISSDNNSPKLAKLICKMLADKFDLKDIDDCNLLNEVLPYAGKCLISASLNSYYTNENKVNTLTEASRYARALNDKEYFDKFCKEVELFALSFDGINIGEHSEKILQLAIHEINKKYKPISTLNVGYYCLHANLIMKNIPSFIFDINDMNNGNSEIDNIHLAFNLGDRLKFLDEKHKSTLLNAIFKIPKSDVNQQMTAFVAGMIDNDSRSLRQNSRIIEHLPEITADFSNPTNFGRVSSGRILSVEILDIKNFVKLASIEACDYKKQKSHKFNVSAYWNPIQIFENKKNYMDFCKQLFDSKDDGTKNIICLEMMKSLLKHKLENSCVMYEIDIVAEVFKDFNLNICSKNYSFDDFETRFDEGGSLYFDDKLRTLEAFLNFPGVNLYKTIKNDSETKCLTIENLKEVDDALLKYETMEMAELVHLIRDKLRKDFVIEKELELTI